jgi:excisionase family DNA binding protein
VGAEPLSFADRLALTVAEAAQVLGVSERHIRNLLPELPHVYLGNRPVIPVDALRKWLDEHAEIQRGRIDTAVDEVLRDLDEKQRES